MPFMFCLKDGRINRSQFYIVKKKGLCRGQLKLAFNNSQGHHQTCLTRRFFFVGLDFMTSVHLERSFGQKKCSRKKVLLFIAKFSSLVWRKAVNSDVGIIVICQSFMMFLTEPPLSYIPQSAAWYLDVTACGFLRMNEWNFYPDLVVFFISYHSHFTLTTALCILTLQCSPNHCPRQPRRGIPTLWFPANEITSCWLFIWNPPFITRFKWFYCPSLLIAQCWLC